METEETRVEERNRKCKKEDDGKGTPWPAPNREERQEAVIERDTAKTKLLNLSQETAAKCEVLLLLPFPQTSNPHYHRRGTLLLSCVAADIQLHTHTHTL